MTRGDSIVSFIKLAVTSAGTGMLASTPAMDAFNAYVQLPVWGVPVTVIGAGFAGSLLSLFFGDPVETRRGLWGQVIASAMFGTAVASLLADGLNWDWATKNMAMFAMMSAAMLRWFLPTMIERGKAVIKELKFSFAKGGDK